MCVNVSKYVVKRVLTQRYILNSFVRVGFSVGTACNLVTEVEKERRAARNGSEHERARMVCMVQGVQ